jgi:hypothetical protein
LGEKKSFEGFEISGETHLLVFFNPKRIENFGQRFWAPKIP